MAGGQPTDYTYDVAAGLPVLLEDGQRTYVFQVTTGRAQGCWRHGPGLSSGWPR